MGSSASAKKEISCRITRTLIMYVREMNGSLGNLLDGLELDERYLTDTNNWISHEFLHVLYARMIEILGDKNPVYKMALASKRFESLGLLDWIVRLLGTPKLIYTQAPKYNRFLKANGDVYIRDSGDSWVVLEDRYHDSSQKTRHDCDYTRGIIAGIPTIFDMPLAHVEEIECQVAPEAYGERIWPDKPIYGSRGCIYRVQWASRERPPLWKRIFQRYRVYRKAINDLQETNQAIQEKYDEARKLACDLETANRELIESRQQLETYTAELQRSELRYRLLAENVTDTIWTMSLEPLRFTYITPSVERMRGYHELRTPLNHIMGFTELILGKNFGDLTETQAEYLTDIYKSSEHLLSLVNQVLDVSKIEAGKLDLNKSEINLKKILEQCLLFMDKAGARNIHLTTDIDQIPETIIADELRVKQIIYNLLSNAVKFTDDGGNIHPEARMTAGPERVTPAETGSLPSDVEISVVDTGIGIRKEDMAKIFDPFAQLESASSRKYPGTGLGLSLTRSLVEMHGGRIWVESAGPGKGSSFRFTLPIQR